MPTSNLQFRKTAISSSNAHCCFSVHISLFLFLSLPFFLASSRIESIFLRSVIAVTAVLHIKRRLSHWLCIHTYLAFFRHSFLSLKVWQVLIGQLIFAFSLLNNAALYIRRSRFYDPNNLGTFPVRVYMNMHVIVPYLDWRANSGVSYA